MKKIKFVELFAGIGGFRYGLEKAENYQCVWANEIDKYAAEIYRKNYGEGELYEEDITKIETKDIPEHDLLVGGFPCQTFSIAGSRAGFNDTRGTLFFEIARILKDKRPRCVLLENVKGLLSHDSGKTFQTILKVLSDIGYRTEWQVLNSSDFGVPQNRERVFIIGHLREESRLQVFPLREGSKQDSKRVGVDTAYCLDANYYKGTNNTTKKCKRQIVCTKQPTSQSKRNMPNTANSIRKIGRAHV